MKKKKKIDFGAVLRFNSWNRIAIIIAIIGVTAFGAPSSGYALYIFRSKLTSNKHPESSLQYL